MLVWHLLVVGVVVVGGGGLVVVVVCGIVLFSNLAVCSLRRPTTLIATFDVKKLKFSQRYEKSEKGTKSPWYESSMVRKVWHSFFFHMCV